MSHLVIEDLHISIGDQSVVDGVSFELAPGERLGLIGASGSGKTMTALSILGLLPDSASVTESIVLDGRQMLGTDDATLAGIRGDLVGMVFQDPLSSLDPLMRVGRQITETLRLRGGLDRSRARAIAAEWCDRVGLPDPELSALAFPHQLSGGQRQRVAIAAALAAGPSLLIADEPTTALDVTVQSDVLDLLEDLVDERGSTLLFITHDLALAARMTSRLAVMDAGAIVESGATTDVISRPAHDATKGLLAAARATSFVDQGPR